MADVSVRAARREDVAEIARIQLDTWRTAYTAILPAPVLEALSVDDAVAVWAAAVTAAPSSAHHVLLALEQDQRVGFTAIAPADGTDIGTGSGAVDAEPTAAIGPLLVEPRWGRRGHGSRLLAAAVDHALADGMTRALTWVPAADAASLSFFRSAGWQADGLTRTLDTGAGELREIRLHVALAELPGAVGTGPT